MFQLGWFNHHLVRKLPVAEKIARLQDQETRLKGLRIRGELQPSYALIDLISNIKETNNVVWIAPSRCGKRDLEIQNSQKQKSSVLSLEQQTLKVTSNEIPTSADTSWDIQLQWALQRRGLAFDQCRLINWDAPTRFGCSKWWVNSRKTLHQAIIALQLHKLSEQIVNYSHWWHRNCRLQFRFFRMAVFPWKSSWKNCVQIPESPCICFLCLKLHQVTKGHRCIWQEVCRQWFNSHNVGHIAM